MLNRMLTDLRFVIGMFLTLVGLVVLGSFIFGPSDAAQGIHVNFLGGGMLTVIGLAMILASASANRD